MTMMMMKTMKTGIKTNVVKKITEVVLIEFIGHKKWCEDANSKFNMYIAKFDWSKQTKPVPVD